LIRIPRGLSLRRRWKVFPIPPARGICGLYSTAIENNIDTIVGVTGGDCSETLALMEILRLRARRSFRSRILTTATRIRSAREMTKFCERLGTTIAQAEA
jgi:hypothetical protein